MSVSKENSDHVMIRQIKQGWPKTAQRFGSGLAVMMLALGTACSAGPTAGNAPALVSQTELLDAIASDEPPLILDVRSPEDFQEGHIPGAVNIDYQELPNQLDELPRDRTIVVYCNVGRRAGIAEETLIEAGFPDVRHLEGDMEEWRSNQQPIAMP
jgi:rhodanese-related sulfurtransferase